jgi:hypothetical protein
MILKPEHLLIHLLPQLRAFNLVEDLGSSCKLIQTFPR